MGKISDYGKSVHQVTDPADDTTGRADAPDTSSDVQPAAMETADDPSAVSRETRVAVTGDLAPANDDTADDAGTADGGTAGTDAS